MISRRELLAAAGAAAMSTSILDAVMADDKKPVFGGWIHTPAAREWFIRTRTKPYLKQLNGQIKGTSDGKAVTLTPYYEQVIGTKFVPHEQLYGTCVGEAATLGAQFLTATQIALHKKNEQWKGPYSVEVTYAGSRVEIGGGAILMGDGSTGAWASEFMRQYGMVLRGRYGDIDLTEYSPALCRKWGRAGAGVPDELEAVAKQHPVRTTALVTSWEEAADSIANGFPVLLCSSIGYNSRTDSEGFLSQSRTWNHAMLVIGMDRRSGKREGGLIANSWGNGWVSGSEHELGTPAGCFWADAKNIDKAIKQGDSFSLSNFSGFPRRDLDYLLI